MPTDLSIRTVAARCVCLAAATVIVLELFIQGARPAAAGLIVAPWDKVAHFAVYSALAALLWVAAAGRMRVALFVAVLALGALDEIHQVDLPGRTADAMDFVADACAAATTVGLLAVLSRRRTAITPRKGQPCAA